MKLLIADKFAEKYIDEIKNLGLDVVYQPKLGEKDLIESARDTNILVVRSTKVNADCINSADKLSLIIRAGAGVNNIDLEAASKRGIYVSNCPGKNSIAVAELAMGLILSIDRKIPDNVADFRHGKWNKALYSKADGLFGKRFGVIGVGKIGTELIKRAKSFGLEIYAWSRSLTPAKAEALEANYCHNIEELVDSCDIISVHLAAKPETKGIISKSVIDRMKPGTIFINTARTEVVDEKSLIEAVKEGKLRAGLDVFDNEPEQKEGTFKLPLQELKDVYVTHHIGASTEQAQNAVAEETVNIIKSFIRTGTINNWVNRCQHTEASWQLIVRHYDKPGVLASVMTTLKKGNINAEELQNFIFDGKIAACCTIQLDRKPSDEMLQEMESKKDEVISVSLVNLNGK